MFARLLSRIPLADAPALHSGLSHNIHETYTCTGCPCKSCHLANLAQHVSQRSLFTVLVQGRDLRVLSCASSQKAYGLAWWVQKWNTTDRCRVFGGDPDTYNVDTTGAWDVSLSISPDQDTLTVKGMILTHVAINAVQSILHS
jgi:hypothetical protein